MKKYIIEIVDVYGRPTNAEIIKASSPVKALAKYLDIIEPLENDTITIREYKN